MSIQKLTELIVSDTNPQLAVATIESANYKPEYLSAATVDLITT